MRKLTSFLAITSVMAVITAIVLWRQLHAERILNAQPEQVMQLEQEQRSAPVQQVVRNAVPEGPAKAGGTAPALARPNEDSSPQNSTAISPAVPDPGKDPDPCAARKAMMRTQLPPTYPDVARVLGLSSSQATALFDLLIRQQETVMDMNCGPEEAQRRARLSAANAMQRQQTELQALLGPAKYQEWQEYLPTREIRRKAAGLRNMLATTDTPLTDQQAEPLLATVLDEDRRVRDEMNSLPQPADARAMLDFQEQRIRLLEESQGRILGGAQFYLAPQQLAVMRNAMARDVAAQRAALRARRAQLDAGGNTDPGRPVAPPP